MKNYILTKIDLLDTFVFADVFDEEKYQIVSESDQVDNLIPIAIKQFKEVNLQFKNWSEWTDDAEDGGYEFEILRNYSSIFRGSVLLLDLVIEKSIELAMKWHAGRARKAGSDTDMVHLLQVSNIIRLLDRANPDKELIASAFCHDLLEDTECPEGEILSACGTEVLQIVKACSNDPALQSHKDWEAKKKKYIESVENGGEKAMLVSLADKIANARVLLELHEEVGDEIWKNFNRGKEKKLWFEKSVFEMLQRHLKDHPLLNEYRGMIEKLEKI